MSLLISELTQERNLSVVIYAVKHSPTVLRLLHMFELIQERNHMNVKYVKGHFLVGDLFQNTDAHTQEKNHMSVCSVEKLSLRVGVSQSIFVHIQAV
jgi:hypothetical protein